MRTALFIGAGLVLGALAVRGGRAHGAQPGVALAFYIAVRVGIAAWNMYQGVATAGYTVAEELPIFLAVALVPIAIVWWLARR
jgi:uncharacterized membrane protein YwaF